MSPPFEPVPAPERPETAAPPASASGFPSPSTPAALGSVPAESERALPSVDPAILGLPTDSDAQVRYLTNSYKGVGKKTAEKLVEGLGEDLFTVLQKDPERVQKLIPSARAENVLEQWKVDLDRRRSRIEVDPAVAQGARLSDPDPKATGDRTGRAREARGRGREGRPRDGARDRRPRGGSREKREEGESMDAGRGRRGSRATSGHPRSRRRLDAGFRSSRGVRRTDGALPETAAGTAATAEPAAERVARLGWAGTAPSERPSRLCGARGRANRPRPSGWYRGRASRPSRLGGARGRANRPRPVGDGGREDPGSGNAPHTELEGLERSRLRTRTSRGRRR